MAIGSHDCTVEVVHAALGSSTQWLPTTQQTVCFLSLHTLDGRNAANQAKIYMKPAYTSGELSAKHV